MKRLLLFLLFILMSCSIFAQDSYIKGRLSFQAGVSRIKNEYVASSTGRSDYIHFYNAASYYGINNWAEVGAFFGYHSSMPNSNTFGFNSKGATYSYGLASKHHLLPWVIKQEKFRFDLYIPINLGASYFASLYSYPAYTETYLGTGLGVAGYLTKHIGLFVEYDYTYWFDKQFRDLDKSTKHRLFYGIVLKF